MHMFNEMHVHTCSITVTQIEISLPLSSNAVHYRYDIEGFGGSEGDIGEDVLERPFL